MGNSDKLQAYTQRILQCGGLVLDPLTGRTNANQPAEKRRKEFVYFRSGCHDRLLLEHLIRNQEKWFTYKELLKILGLEEGETLSKNEEKYVNDKIEAVKRKLEVIGFSRKECGDMFVCHHGYMLVPPREGKKYSRSRP